MLSGVLDAESGVSLLPPLCWHALPPAACLTKATELFGEASLIQVIRRQDMGKLEHVFVGVLKEGEGDSRCADLYYWQYRPCSRSTGCQFLVFLFSLFTTRRVCVQIATSCLCVCVLPVCVCL